MKKISKDGLTILAVLLSDFLMEKNDMNVGSLVITIFNEVAVVKELDQHNLVLIKFLTGVFKDTYRWADRGQIGKFTLKSYQETKKCLLEQLNNVEKGLDLLYSGKY